MAWLQLTVVTTPTAAAAIETLLEHAGASAVSLEDGGDDPILEPELNTTPLWATVRVRALFTDDATGQQQAQAAAASVAPRVNSAPVLTILPEQAWERCWLAHRQPQCFGGRLWVGAQEQLAALALPANTVVVKLDPGLAFGTGDHATTALCLEWLANASIAGQTVIDYGCGSGILAIAALQLGAVRAIAIDHDPQALEATAANAVVNDVAARLMIATPPAGVMSAAPVVLANILAEPLMTLAPQLTALVLPRGHLVLSGILTTQTAAVQAAYQPAMTFAPVQIRDEWALLDGMKR